MDAPFIDAGLILKDLGLIAVERSAGLRTFPLVAMASCGYILIASRVLAGHPKARPAFIGGGAILKSEGAVRGTATAASVWNTGAIGAAVAVGRYEIAVVLAGINFAALRWLAPLKEQIRKDSPS